jgi:hypothetical protein
MACALKSTAKLDRERFRVAGSKRVISGGDLFSLALIFYSAQKQV